MRAIIVVFCLTVASAPAAPVPKGFAKKRADAEVFVGAWDTVVAESAGQPTGKATWTFDANRKMVSAPSNSEWAITLDPTKSPKEIDIGHYKGIYQFDGGDIKIAFASGQRPTDFDAKPGVFYNLLRRVPDGKK